MQTSATPAILMILSAFIWLNAFAQNSATPLATQHGGITINVACDNCHALHPITDPKSPKKQPDICLKCHGKDIKRADGRTIKGFEKLFNENPTQHYPVMDGFCTACHHMHASTEKPLLQKHFPTEFYTDGKEQAVELCLTCHKSDLVTKVAVKDETNFRNGGTNLHYLHVTGKNKGRTCRACHEVHASVGPSLIATWVPFRKYEFPIKFEATARGGSCTTACHGLKRYDREKAIENAKHR